MAISDPAMLGAVIRGTRRSHGLTQSQLAGLAGTGLRFVSELERGKPNVALDKVLAVLAVLGLRLQAVEAGS
ncbi:type II toxin-antitoxin system Y4mF family antitoxin [Marilutibacter maris]|nr:type II toxin-antitoxin system Y4mF family antitoxin [Lysobacter maris]